MWWWSSGLVSQKRKLAQRCGWVGGLAPSVTGWYPYLSLDLSCGLSLLLLLVRWWRFLHGSEGSSKSPSAAAFAGPHNLDQSRLCLTEPPQGKGLPQVKLSICRKHRCFSCCLFLLWWLFNEDRAPPVRAGIHVCISRALLASIMRLDVVQRTIKWMH